MWRSRLAIVSLCAALLVLTLARSAFAQRAFDLQLYTPAPGPLSGLSLERARLLPHGEWVLGASFTHAHGLLAREAADGARILLVSELEQLELSAGVGVLDVMELGLVVPLSLVRAADDFETPRKLENGAGLGDLRALAKLPLVRGAFALALLLRATFPSGDADDLRGERRWTATPGLSLGVLPDRAGEPQLAATLGYRLRAREAAVGFELDDEVDAGVAVSVSLSSFLRALAEARVRAGVGGRDFGRQEVPVEFDLGVRLSLSRHLGLLIGGGTGYWPNRDAYGAPDYRVVAGLRFRSRAACEGEGCARVGLPDRDADGVPDEADGCPSAPEDRDGFVDRDGCPDFDDDADGIADAADACPRETEDRDGYQDADGCPEPDNDADGIADGADRCAMDPEDRDGFEDADGCPEPGPEPRRITVAEGRILVSERVFFEFERDTIRAVSIPLLEELAQVINDLPSDLIVQIEGHTDDSGNAAYNVDLSHRRAEAVAAFLRSRGVPAGRMRAVGYGAAQPVADNDSPDGRALNRRVEFKLIARASTAE